MLCSISFWFQHLLWSRDQFHSCEQGAHQLHILGMCRTPQCILKMWFHRKSMHCPIHMRHRPHILGALSGSSNPWLMWLMGSHFIWMDHYSYRRLCSLYLSLVLLSSILFLSFIDHALSLSSSITYSPSPVLRSPALLWSSTSLWWCHFLNQFTICQFYELTII